MLLPCVLDRCRNSDTCSTPPAYTVLTSSRARSTTQACHAAPCPFHLTPPPSRTTVLVTVPPAWPLCGYPLQRMSGIATATAAMVSALEGLPTRVLETRKTVPGRLAHAAMGWGP